MKFFIVSIFLFTSLNCFTQTKELPIEDYISEKEILANVTKYHKRLDDKAGYRGAKTWATLIKYAAKEKDAKLLHSMLTRFSLHEKGRIEHRRDMYDLLSLNPEFFVKEFDAYYKNKKYCLNWFFDKKKYPFPVFDFKSFKSKRIRLLESRFTTENQKKECSTLLSKKIAEGFRG